MIASRRQSVLSLPRKATPGGGFPMIAPDGWKFDESGKAIVRSISFADFSEAFAFLTRVALHAEKVDHHPEFTSVWNRVDFRLTSHDSGGVTDRDCALAEAISKLAGN
jgi:4a-hydroxytetrahydrobiopterin dehydratase